ncbi:hypothetical protein M3Y99_00289900 [Aphelenchoides fujianensis]|nr:hypothetical protein M3Y99_00289900 [Aphelenchoides fujianensis]
MISTQRCGHDKLSIDFFWFLSFFPLRPPSFHHEDTRQAESRTAVPVRATGGVPLERVVRGRTRREAERRALARPHGTRPLLFRGRPDARKPGRRLRARRSPICGERRPNLDIFWLIGGYHFTPAHKTVSALRAELLDVVANLRAFTRALSTTNWRLFSHTSEGTPFRYILFAHMNEEFANSGALVPLLAQTLRHAPTRRELADRYFVTTHVWNGVKVFLELGVFTTTPSLHPVGRTKLLDGDHLINAGPECQRDGNLNCGGGPKNAA